MGYDVWDEEKKLQDDVEILEEQQDGESREDFFTRIGMAPNKSEYGSQLTLDIALNDSDWKTRAAVLGKDYAETKLLEDEYFIVSYCALRSRYYRTKIMPENDELIKLFDKAVMLGYSLEDLANSNDTTLRKFVEATQSIVRLPRSPMRAGDNLDKLIEDFNVKDSQHVLGAVARYTKGV